MHDRTLGIRLALVEAVLEEDVTVVGIQLKGPLDRYFGPAVQRRPTDVQ